jgi:hypothetical protein
MNNKRVAIGLMQMCMSQRLRRRRVAAGSGFTAHACNVVVRSAALAQVHATGIAGY